MIIDEIEIETFRYASILSLTLSIFGIIIISRKPIADMMLSSMRIKLNFFVLIKNNAVKPKNRMALKTLVFSEKNWAANKGKQDKIPEKALFFSKYLFNKSSVNNIKYIGHT